MITNNIGDVLNKWISVRNNNDGGEKEFLKKLMLHWVDIVENEKFARYSAPGKIIREDPKKICLLIFSYNGAVTINLQGMIKKIEQNIKLHIGYFPVNSIRIMQKAGRE